MPARGRRVGLTEIGLPYAADPAITRHLARFLGQQAGSLHTGGVDRSSRRRSSSTAASSRRPSSGSGSIEVLSTWAGDAVPALEGGRPRPRRRPRGGLLRPGAARQGGPHPGRRAAVVLRRHRDRPRPAVPGVPPPIKALCVVPMGMEEGTETDVPGPEFGLVVGEPAEFRFLGSTTRRDDPVGTVLDRWSPDELQELAPMETALAAEDGKPGETVPVRLHSHVTEVGTLELWCNSTRDDRRWKLEFNVREHWTCRKELDPMDRAGLALKSRARSRTRWSFVSRTSTGLPDRVPGRSTSRGSTRSGRATAWRSKRSWSGAAAVPRPIT